MYSSQLPVYEMMPSFSSCDLQQKAFVFLGDCRYNDRVEFIAEHGDG
jgi:hypothetical protein